MTMQKITKSIDINASPEKVWHVLTDPETYTEWASIFSPDGKSYAKSDWQKGSEVAFTDGAGEGIHGTVIESVPGEVIAFKYDAEIAKDGTLNYETVMKDGEERYMLTENNGGTRLDISSDMTEEMLDMMSGSWDNALQRVKELAEQA